MSYRDLTHFSTFKGYSFQYPDRTVLVWFPDTLTCEYVKDRFTIIPIACWQPFDITHDQLNKLLTLA